MRERRFKGKRTNDGKWVEGLPSYGHRLDSVDVGGTTGYKLQMHIISDGYQYPVDPDTVGQGIYIDGEWYYEGDIFWDGDNEEYCVLVWDGMGFVLERKGGIIAVDDFCWLEKVGNVWDNPELVGWYNAQTKDGDENGI